MSISSLTSLIISQGSNEKRLEIAVALLNSLRNTEEFNIIYYYEDFDKYVIEDIGHRVNKYKCLSILHSISNKENNITMEEVNRLYNILVLIVKYGDLDISDSDINYKIIDPGQFYIPRKDIIENMINYTGIIIDKKNSVEDLFDIVFDSEKYDQFIKYWNQAPDYDFSDKNYILLEKLYEQEDVKECITM